MRFVALSLLLLSCLPALAAPKATVPFQVKWGVTAFEYGIDEFVRAKPLLHDGVVYFADNKGLLKARDGNTGKELWRKQLPDAVNGGPSMSSAGLLLGTRDADVILVNPQTAEVIWSAKVTGEVLAPPVANDTTVVVQTNDGRINALRLQDGLALWTYDRNVPLLSLRGTSEPLIVGDRVLVGFANGQAAALSLADGKLVWETPVSIAKGRSELERMVDIDARMLQKDGTVYVSAFQGRVAALGFETGSLLWSREISTYLDASINDRQMFVTASDGKLWALDTESGTTLWMQDKFEEKLSTAPQLIGNYVLVGDRDSNLHLFAAEDGRFIQSLSYEEIAEDAGVISFVDILESFYVMKGDDVFARPGVASAVAPTKQQTLVSYRNGVVAHIRFPSP